MDIIRISKAMTFAMVAHEGQTRKDKNVPYIVHPLGVGVLLAKAGANDDVIIAGILHDTIEDTNVSYTQIKTEFGKTVADLVTSVTNPFGVPSDIRKQIILKKVPTMLKDTALIKSADLIYNINDSLSHYDNFEELPFSTKHAQYYLTLIDAIAKRKTRNPLLSDLLLARKKLARIGSL